MKIARLIKRYARYASYGVSGSSIDIGQTRYTFWLWGIEVLQGGVTHRYWLKECAARLEIRYFFDCGSMKALYWAASPFCIEISPQVFHVRTPEPIVWQSVDGTSTTLPAHTPHGWRQAPIWIDYGTYGPWRWPAVQKVERLLPWVSQWYDGKKGATMSWEETLRALLPAFDSFGCAVALPYPHVSVVELSRSLMQHFVHTTQDVLTLYGGWGSGRSVGYAYGALQVSWRWSRSALRQVWVHNPTDMAQTLALRLPGRRRGASAIWAKGQRPRLQPCQPEEHIWHIPANCALHLDHLEAGR